MENKKTPAQDVAKDIMTQIMFLAHNALTWGHDKEEILKEIQRLAESAHNCLCVKEVYCGKK